VYLCAVYGSLTSEVATVCPLDQLIHRTALGSKIIGYHVQMGKNSVMKLFFLEQFIDGRNAFFFGN
jgi:hypothetical protein